MLDNSITITYDAESVTLNRIDWGYWSGADAAGNDYMLEVKHVQPKSGFADGVRQHLIKLTRLVYTDVDGVSTLTNQTSAHTVVRSSIGQQDDTICVDLVASLQGHLDATELGKILDFRS